MFSLNHDRCAKCDAVCHEQPALQVRKAQADPDVGGPLLSWEHANITSTNWIAGSFWQFHTLELAHKVWDWLIRAARAIRPDPVKKKELCIELLKPGRGCFLCIQK